MIFYMKFGVNLNHMTQKTFRINELKFAPDLHQIWTTKNAHFLTIFFTIPWYYWL